MNILRIYGIVLLVMIGIAGEHPARAQEQPFFFEPLQSTVSSPFEIQAAVIPEKIAPGRWGTIRLTLDIAPKHKVYAERTSVAPDPVPGLAFGKLRTPPTVEKKEPDGNTARFYKGKAVFDLPVQVLSSAKPGKADVRLRIRYQGCSEMSCFLPEEKQLLAHLSVDPIAGGGEAANVASAPVPDRSDIGEPNPFQEMAGRFGLIGGLLAAFAWGFLTSLTPCIYPMIPVTVSVIGASNAGGVFRGFVLSLLYILGMSLTYAAFGVAAAWSGGLFGAYTDHPVVRMVVAGIFVGLALSMFDLFHIQMPSRIASGFGKYSAAGSIGVFLTGAAAGMVVGPCVGPMLVGLLVYIAALGDKVQGFLIMWSFALGMGMLFLLIGTFSGVATSLPRAGRWMENLKQLFGVLMLGAALYYVKPLMPDAVFLLILGGLLIGIGIFVGALDRLDGESPGYDRLRKSAGILCLTLGIAYAARFALGDMPGGFAPSMPAPKAGIVWQTDEAAGLALARQQGKPALIDFSADWCAACKKLERETFTHPGVIEKAGEFVAIRVDCTDTDDPLVKKLQQKYRVVGLPTILFLDKNGRLLPEASVSEFVGPSVMLERMGQAFSPS